MNIILSFWKESVIYGIGSFLVRTISFLLIPFYTHCFNQSEVGHIFLLFALIAFLQIFYNHGLESSFLKFYSLNDKNKDVVGATLIVALYISSFLFSLILFVFGGILFEFLFGFSNSSWVYCCSGILFFDSTSNRILTLIRIKKKSLLFFFVNVGSVIIALIFNFIFVVKFNLGISGVLFGTLLGSVFRWLPVFPFVLDLFKKGTFSFNVYKQCLRFGLPFLPAAIFHVIMEVADRYLILWYLDSSAVGVYSIGYKIGSIIMLIVTAFNLGWQPFYNRIGSEKNAKLVFAQIGSYFLFFIMILCSLISIWTPVIMKLKFGDSYLIDPAFWISYSIIPIILFSYVFYSFYIVAMPSMYIYNKQLWAPLFRFSGAFSNIILNILFIPRFGLLGAAIATLISYLIMTVFLFYKSNQWMRVPYNWGLIIKQFMLTVLTVVVFVQLSPTILNCFLITLFYFSLLLSIGFYSVIKKIFKQLF